jgi:GTP cyclohydrolase I
MIANHHASDAHICTLCEPAPSMVQADQAAPATEQGQPVDLSRIAGAVREILLAVGEDPDRDGLVDTPGRVAKAYAELFRGLHESPAEHLSRVFEQEHGQTIVLRDIEFFSLCEHHLLPFMGKAHVAYLPGDGKIVGLSKLARTVEVFARRPQVQERLTDQIADAIAEHLGAAGVAVVVEAEHMCMKMRGVSKPHSTMVTTAFRGVLADDDRQRDQAMRLMKL